MVASKACHLQRIADDAAGFFGQILQIGVHVIVRYHHRVALFQQAFDTLFQLDALVRQRSSKIACLNQGAAGGGGEAQCDNAQDVQSVFDALFFSVCGVCGHMPMQQSLQIARHIMGSSSTAVVAAVSAAPLSAAALKSFNRLIQGAMRALHLE